MAGFQNGDRVRTICDWPNDNEVPEFAGSWGTVDRVDDRDDTLRVVWDEKLRDGTDYSWIAMADVVLASWYSENMQKICSMTREELAKFLARPCPYDSDKCIELGHETCEACFLDWLSK